MRLHGILDTGASDEAEESKKTRHSTRAQLSKEQRKFHKFEALPPSPRAAATRSERLGFEEDLAAPAGASGDAALLSDLPRGITSEQIAFIRRLRTERPARPAWMTWCLAALLSLLIVAAFAAGRVNSRAPVSPPPKPVNDEPKAPAGLPANARAFIDQAMTAAQAKKYAEATELLEQARHAAGHINGLDYQVAALCYQSKDLARVLPLLNLSINEGEDLAASYHLRGIFSNGSAPTTQGLNDLEKATELAPFDAEYLFDQGEALRRAGKPQEALVALNRALDRLQEPALFGRYSLKVRLSQLEQGQDHLFAGEMAAQLKHSPVPVDWLLTAAAVDMQRGDFIAAAEQLLRVRALIGQVEMATWLQDAYFTNFAHEKELARFFEKAPAPAPSSPIPDDSQKPLFPVL